MFGSILVSHFALEFEPLFEKESETVLARLEFGSQCDTYLAFFFDSLSATARSQIPLEC